MPGFEIFGEEEKKEVLEVFDTGVLFRYEFKEQRNGVWKVKTFENEIEKYTGAKYAQAVSSGSTALKVALAALGIGPGDEVITQGFTFVATPEAILEIGAIPVFGEIDDTLNLDPKDLENKITDKTKAIILVHMCGAPGRIEEVVEIAKKHNIKVIEDTAQSIGARINGKHLGTFGDAGTFSFDSVKTITTGEGGMVVTNNEDTYKRAFMYHDHGHDHTENPSGRGGEGCAFSGFNYRMQEISGAIGLAQLKKLDNILKIQKENKKKIKDVLKNIEGITLRTLLDEDGDSATFLGFALPTEEKTRAFNEILKREGAGAVYWYDNVWHYYKRWKHLFEKISVHANKWPYNDVDYSPDALPKSDEILSKYLFYQIKLKMSEEDINKTINAIKMAAKEVL